MTAVQSTARGHGRRLSNFAVRFSAASRQIGEGRRGGVQTREEHGEVTDLRGF